MKFLSVITPTNVEAFRDNSRINEDSKTLAEFKDIADEIEGGNSSIESKPDRKWKLKTKNRPVGRQAKNA